jgi:acetylglutamate kinase
MKTPRGFAFAGLNAGIKAARKDFALIWSDAPCSAAGAFTINKARAAPVRDAASRLPTSVIRAIVVNSGNANALTGPAGEDDVRAVRTAIATALGVDVDTVLAASTGVLGVRLPVKKLVAAAPMLAAARSIHAEGAAEAIFTTDTRLKLAHRVLTLGGTSVCISAFAKGSGMVAPALATVLAFITTDAVIAPALLKECLDVAIDGSFDDLVIDNEMSPNDAIFALANGLAKNQELRRGDPDLARFQDALTSVCAELARAIAEDGEGATKVIEVRVSGAPDTVVAKDLAKAVAGSTLVKTAIYGADPNWGRILSTIGARAGARKFAIDPMLATVSLQGMSVFADGAPSTLDPIALRAKMREPNILIDVKLAEGNARATALGCDLSYDYVKINADYISFTGASPDGVVARDDRLTNYSPSFKRSLLVEALSYISRFANKRAVITFGGAGMVKDSLKASFAGDVNLLRSAGLLPIVVHGGGPEVASTLEALGRSVGEHIDGVRVTSADDLEVVEMVVSGKINSELVSLLNQEKAHAVGLSGKDAGLLRCKKLRADDGRDLGMVGEVTHVNHELLEVLLAKQYIPVVSPIGLGEDGDGYNLSSDTAAAAIAIALQAEKLIYLSDVPGILERGELVSEIGARALREKLEQGVLNGPIVSCARSCLRAIEAGVISVHIIDGRTPHSLIAELFTDRGVGTLIVRD